METTTRANLLQLQQTLIEQYTAQINALPFKKNQRADLIAGFGDGVRSGIQHMCAMLEITVTE